MQQYESLFRQILPYTRLGIANCNWSVGVPHLWQFKIIRPPHKFKARFSNHLGSVRTGIST